MMTVWWISTIFFETIWVVEFVLWILTISDIDLVSKWKFIRYFGYATKYINYGSAYSGYWVLQILVFIYTLILPVTNAATYESFYNTLPTGRSELWVGGLAAGFSALIFGLNTWIQLRFASDIETWVEAAEINLSQVEVVEVEEEKSKD